MHVYFSATWRCNRMHLYCFMARCVMSFRLNTWQFVLQFNTSSRNITQPSVICFEGKHTGVRVTEHRDMSRCAGVEVCLYTGLTLALDTSATSHPGNVFCTLCRRLRGLQSRFNPSGNEYLPLQGIEPDFSIIHLQT